MTNDDGRVNEIRRHGFGSRLNSKTGLNDSNGSLNVVAGLSEFVYDLFGVVMAARFEVELDTATWMGFSRFRRSWKIGKKKLFWRLPYPSLHRSNTPTLRI